MKKPFQLRSILLILVGLCITILVVDYFNIPSKLGFNIRYLNLDLQAIVLNSLLTVGMFALAYYLIDQWEAKKHNNKTEIANQLLLTSYELCESNIEDLDNHPVIKKMLIESRQKKEGKRVLDIEYFNNFENLPFENHDLIIQFCAEGILTKAQYKEYMSIKSLFSTYISIIELNSDDSSMQSAENDIKVSLYSLIKNAKKKLK